MIIGVNVAKLTSQKVDNVGYSIPIERFLVYKNTLPEIDNSRDTRIKRMTDVNKISNEDDNSYLFNHCH